MTTIIGTQTTLYADSCTSEDGKIFNSRKLYRMGRSVFGIAGDCKSEGLFLEWYPRRAKHEIPNYDADSIDVLEVNKDGLWLWNNGNAPFRIDSPFYSIGSGSKYALTAMHLGRTPEGAMDIACLLDINSGGALQVLTQKNVRRKGTNRTTSKRS